MVYSERATRELYRNLETVNYRRLEMQQRYCDFSFSNEKAKEYAAHGFSRRLKTLSFCIDKIFSILPPELDKIPEEKYLYEATIHIQSFISNTYGCIDNLAWIWRYEKNVTDRKGRLIEKFDVGLRPKNKDMRTSFSRDFQDYLSTLDDWFGLLEDFRDALAHRIPLYIPPYFVPDDNKDEYIVLQTEMQQSLKVMDFNTYDLLNEKLEKLGKFRPIISHSISEESKHVFFHGQILMDFTTVHDIASKMLIELNA